MMRPEDLVGQLLGRYRILRLVDYGGMSTVFLAQDTQLQREIAIKVFWPRPGETVDFLHRFAREAQVLAQLDHPCILPIYDYGEQNGLAYLIMPYMAGGSLKDLLQVRRVFPPTEAMRLITQVLNALQYAYERGLIHRDIKPGNILLKTDGTALLSDFGLVKVLTPDRDGRSSAIAATQSGKLLAGTPEYMAPEQIMGQAQPASDLYSTGVVLYEMLTGTRPFVAEVDMALMMKHMYEQPPSMRQFNPQISPQLDAVVLRALEKDPTRRYQRPDDFQQALVQAAQSQGPVGISGPANWPTPTVPAAWLPPQQGGSPISPTTPGSIPVDDPEAGRATFVKNLPWETAAPQSMGGSDPEANIHTFVRNPQSGAYPPFITSQTPQTPQSDIGTFIPGTLPTPTSPRRTRLSLIAGAVALLIIVSLLVSLFALPQGRRLLGLGAGPIPTNTIGSKPTPHHTPTGTAVVPGVKGGTWTDALFEQPDSLIPNASAITFSYIVDQAIWTPLFYGDAQGNIQPGLATVIPTLANGGISSDVKTWTFHLRSGLKWSDGQPLDARDVNFTWQLWNNPSFSAASNIGFNLITSADISSDNLSITFHLKQSYSPFLSNWVDGINAPLPAHHFSSMAPSQILKTADNLKPSVTSGPFMMSESVPNDHFTVVRNTNYYQASQTYPYLDKVVFRIVPNQGTILQYLQAGTIDSAWFLDVTKVPAYQQLTNYKLTSNPNASNFEAMYFDFHNPILGTDVSVRKAIAMAIDHQALITSARHGEAQPLCTDHGSAFNPGYESNAPCPKFDAAAANALLDSDGWTGGSGGVRTKGGQSLEFKYSTIANNAWQEADGLIIQQNLKAIGIKIDIQNYAAGTLFGTVLPQGKSGVYDIAEFANSGQPYDADDSSLFACSNSSLSNGFNLNFYCNNQLDNLYVQERSTADPTARQQIFNQIHQIYLTDFPFITLYGSTDIAMSKNITHNYNPGPFGASESINIWQWWCSSGQC